jgi:predicted RNA binding protein YcfA (HicA-like mRNA interferase family)
MPHDFFTYDELVKLLNDFGFYEQATGKTSGSRLRFVNAEFPQDPVIFHKPHPQKEMKEYVLRQILSVLTNCALLDSNDEKK